MGKIMKKTFNEFIVESAKTFGYNSKKEYLEERAKNNFVVMEKDGEDEEGNGKYKPLQWEDGAFVVLNTRELAEDEAKEYDGAIVITEYEMYKLYGIVA